MAIHTQERGFVKMLKNVRIKGIGAVQKGDVVDAPVAEVAMLIRRGDATRIEGGSKEAEKAEKQARKQREKEEAAEAQRIEQEAAAAQEAQEADQDQGEAQPEA